ncbi:hypothetical protein L596_026693 [Steinernema carpocapsae]|uniref:Uncharacterized protein n=1 Tax=Steinernema carpocapsae TaxID=34508 RepID=A0A4U5M245_STECR|nr:hypothetical protein L596_026693 [Steinernema carpocapsae]
MSKTGCSLVSWSATCEWMWTGVGPLVVALLFLPALTLGLHEPSQDATQWEVFKSTYQKEFFEEQRCFGLQ